MGDTVTGNPTRNAYTGPIDLSRPHFVGVGGSAMSGLAQLCAARGSAVSGTDAIDSARLHGLRAAGCTITVGHDPHAVDDASCVVYTTVASHAPEITAAREQGIPIVHRMQVLNELATGRSLIAVAGTHGKSTTTGMIVAGLRSLGADPSFLVGADLDEPGSGVQDGRGNVFVAEADESDRAFHFLKPAVVVITGIAHDHPENYADLDEHIDAYVTFAAGMQDHGVLVVNADDEASQHLRRRVQVLRPDLRVVTFGESQGATVWRVNMGRTGWNSHADVRVSGTDGLCHIRIPTPSPAHVGDALAAMAVLVALGHTPRSAAGAVSTFAGVGRRFTLIGEAGAVRVIDCHADHHNEIASDLGAAVGLAREQSRRGRVIAVVQPSGYARVQAFGRQIGMVLAQRADCTILLDVHGAAPIPGVTSTIIGDAAILAGGAVRYTTRHEVPDLVAAMVGPHDVVVLLGVGDVGTLAAPILNAVESTALVLA